jgi:glycosyltransferase involved in cell wall biosynthesis
MKILFVMIDVPFPSNSGQRTRNLSLLRAIQREGHEVSILAFGEVSELASVRQGLGDLGIDLAIVPQPSGLGQVGPIGRMRALFSNLPYGAWRMRSKAMAALTKSRLATKEFDLVICDDVYQIENLTDISDTAVILNKHTIVFEEFERFLQLETNFLVRAYGAIELAKLRRLEIKTAQQVAAVWPCSERDRRILLGANTEVPSPVVPNAIDGARFEPANCDDGRTLLYVGAMDWLPNRDAVEFFVFEIMPKVRELVPNAQFLIAGREPPSRFRRRIERVPHVTFTGTLPDLRPTIANAAICVVPLRIGSGTRLKILEAAASAKAIVSTTIGAEGLNLVDGSEILIADDPAAFANAVASLLLSRERRLAMGKKARERALSEYSLPALQNAVHAALSEIQEQPFGYRRASA